MLAQASPSSHAEGSEDVRMKFFVFIFPATGVKLMGVFKVSGIVVIIDPSC